MKKITVFLLFIITLSGCEKKFNDLTDIQQDILFKSEYMNYAWVPQHSGILINREGDIYGFNLPEKWNFPDEDDIISSSEMDENFEQANEFLGTIDADELIKYLNKLYKVDPEELTNPERDMYDAGVRTFSGYFYDQDNDTYIEVLLRQTGDTYIENKSREAAQIYNWLLTFI